MVEQERVLTKDGRFNYNRSFRVDTLPQINGVPVLGKMGLEDVGVSGSRYETLERIIRGCWSQYGIFLPECSN